MEYDPGLSVQNQNHNQLPHAEVVNSEVKKTLEEAEPPFFLVLRRKSGQKATSLH